LVVDYLRFMLKSAGRNKRRTALTVLGVAASLFLLVSLRTFLGELEGNSTLTPTSNLRLITFRAVSMAVPLPIAYRQQIERVPGVELVSPFQWFGGYYQDPKNFFAQFAVDAEAAVRIASDYKFQPAEVEAFIKDRTGAMVAQKLMDRFGWKVGERITIIGGLFPFNPELTIRGTYHGPDENGMWFHYDYYNELMHRHLPGGENTVASFWTRARSAEDVPRIAAAIDAMFRNSGASTKTDTEKAFALSFTSMLGNIRLFLSLIAMAVLFAIFLVTANTMAMTVRERSAEVAVLKTLGFRRSQILAMLVGESVTVALAGGVIGVGGARIILGNFNWYRATSGVIQHFQITVHTMVLGMVLAVLLGACSAVVPAWRASRQSIVAALRTVG
jgi:putative ABC transport system permease protein